MMIFRFLKRFFRRILIRADALVCWRLEYEYVNKLSNHLMQERNRTKFAFDDLKFDFAMCGSLRTFEEYEYKKSIALKKFYYIERMHNFSWCRMENTIGLRRYYLTLKPLKSYKNVCSEIEILLNKIEEYRQDQIYFRNPSTIEYELKKLLARFKKYQVGTDFDMERT